MRRKVERVAEELRHGQLAPEPGKDKLVAIRGRVIEDWSATATQLRESWRACLDRSDTAVDRIIRRLDELLAHLWFGVIHAEPMPAFWSKRVPSSISDATLGLISGHVEYLRGQRWFETGLAPCLFLRSLHLSERLRPCFEILQTTPIASLRAASGSGGVPDLR